MSAKSGSPKAVPPLVPAPDSDFAAFVDSMTAALEAGTSHAAQFPDKSDLMFHRTLDRKFARGIDSSGQRVLKLADQLLQLTVDSQPKTKNRLKPRRKLADEDDVVDSFHSTVVEHVDSLLEDADHNLDEVNGELKKAAIQVNPSAHAMKNLPGPAYSNGLPMNLALNSQIEKPQLLFDPPVDNSPDLPQWTPTLKEKAHAMVPLDFIVSSDEDVPFVELGDPAKDKARRERRDRARLHPYYYETRHLPYPTSLFTSREPIPPKSFEETPFEFVDTPEKLEAMTEVLLQAKEIAVDLEYHSIRSYYGFTCLIQISTRERDWVVDSLALRSQLREHKFGGVMADPSVIKVFHGADSDIVWLQQDFDIYVVNLFDTYHAAKTLEFPKLSLASLFELYCDFEPDKKYQMADWRIRPLPEEMMFYARADTHFLLFIYDSLRNALIARASRTPSPSVEGGEEGTPKPNPQRAIRQVLDLSAETALRLHSRITYDVEKGQGHMGWANMAKKLLGKNESLDAPVGYAFKRLHHWRDTLARQLDESPHYLFPNHTLMHIAHTRPKNPEVLSRILGKAAPSLLPRIPEIVTLLQESAKAYAEDHKVAKPSTAPSAGASDLSPAAKDFTPAAKRVKSNPPARPTTVDVWAELISGQKRGTVKKPSTSALFGKTLSTAAAAAPSTSSAASSSLFGNTLNKKGAPSSRRQQSPGFESIQSSIHSSFQKAPVEIPTVEAAASNQVAEPETVAFVPAGERKIPTSDFKASTNASSNKGKARADAAEVASEAPTDTVVSVRKQKKKSKSKTASASAPGSTEGSGAPSPAAEDKPKSKTRNIPAFDYSAEPNLLDQPVSSSSVDKAAAKKSKKKDKGKDKAKDKAKDKKAATSASANRRPPSNPSEPKSGNKSGTFMG